MGTPVRSAARHEAAAAEPLELVALLERLADPLEALGPDADQVAAAEHPLGVLVAGQGRAAAPGHLAHERHPEDQVGAEQAQEPAGVVVHRDHRHQRVDRDRARVVGHDQRAALVGDVLDAAHLDAEPLLGDRPQQRERELLGDLGVEAELVDLVVAGQPPPEQREQLGQPRLPLLAPDLLGRGPQHREPGVRRDAGERLAVAGGGRGADRLDRCRRWWRHGLGGDLLDGLGGRRRTPGGRARLGRRLLRGRLGREVARAPRRAWRDRCRGPTLPRVPIGMISASATSRSRRVGQEVGQAGDGPLGDARGRGHRRGEVGERRLGRVRRLEPELGCASGSCRCRGRR